MAIWPHQHENQIDRIPHYIVISFGMLLDVAREASMPELPSDDTGHVDCDALGATMLQALVSG